MERITFWSLPISELFQRVSSSPSGLAEGEAVRRRKDTKGENLQSPLRQELSCLLRQFSSPLVLILIFAVLVSAFIGEYTNTAIILTIILFSGLLGFAQERNANKAIKALQEMVQIKVSVKRANNTIEIPIADVVPGDIVLLNAGDIIPGDCRLIEVNDLHVNEASLTGESFPTEKTITELDGDTPLSKRSNCVFKGSNVVNGTAQALVITTGANTEFGAIAVKLNQQYHETSFEIGVRKFGYMLMQITLIIAILILSLNIYLGKPIIDSFLFVLALAIGMTPELLPAIVTITLSAGAKRMASKKVIVKKLSAIQNLGSIDVLCSDKTGTLTEGVIKVQATLDVEGNHSERVKSYAYLNALFETGFTNPLDDALRGLTGVTTTGFLKTDEVPYDFIRKRLSIVVATDNRHIMITKGAVKNVLEVCKDSEPGHNADNFKEEVLKKYETYSSEGFRTIGISFKDVTDDPVITKEDETDMTFLGFILLYDPPKAGVIESLKQLADSGISVKMITGDNQLVASYLAKRIGLTSHDVITGSEIAKMSDEALIRRVGEVNVFAETEPHHKEQLVNAFRKAGHVVGYLGDGINDVSAMKAADISISVDSAVDVAKETADLVLLRKDLQILKEGIHEGRKTFTNTMKYIFITTSANFGNMFSMAGVSLLVPFLPLLPIQILLTNFLSDLPAIAIAGDRVDPETMLKPRKWNTGLIRNFMLIFGLESSLFDFLTFFALLYVVRASESVFQTGWFLVSVTTEILVLMIIRTHRSIFRSRPGKYMVYAAIFVIGTAVLLPYSPVGEPLGLVPLPLSTLGAMGVITLLYCFATEFTKIIFFKRMKI